MAGTMVLLDSLLFAGASLPRIRSLAEEPFWFRLAIVIYSPVAEELVYRFIIMALLAWIAYALLSHVCHEALPLALWIGILVLRRCSVWPHRQCPERSLIVFCARLHSTGWRESYLAGFIGSGRDSRRRSWLISRPTHLSISFSPTCSELAGQVRAMRSEQPSTVAVSAARIPPLFVATKSR